ncbi:hypothetical protein D5S17_12445 [Pseudonocardiaceae bacterium YIM PH 21723]|nr:hypothetical protein D5S17_12445 [Pseudonocardiaceae bacterium YIM PH 21723]
MWVVACLLLARWQWDRAQEAGGSLQNLAYAIQWPLFGGFGVFLWFRLRRLEAQKQATDQEQAPEPEPLPEPAPVPVRRPVAQVEEPDDELAAYNRMLAQLNGRDQG